MNTPLHDTALGVVILKRDPLHREVIRRAVLAVWPNASVRIFQHGIEALTSIQATKPNLFIAGLLIEDMDGLEHLEPFVDMPELAILVVTSRREPWFFEMLRALRFDGVFDGHADRVEKLSMVVEQVAQRHRYVSPSMVQQLKRRQSRTLDDLTKTQQMVLSAIGDGADDREAGERLGMLETTVATHRKAIMRKLNKHDRGALVRYAIQQGYVSVTPDGTSFPGFQRRFSRRRSARKRERAEIETTTSGGDAISGSCRIPRE